jgi:AraC-like DNA-binding protein
MFALLETPADLRPWVRCIWTLHGEADAQPDPPIAPDGCCEWIVHVGQPPMMAVGEHWVRQPREFLFGQLNAPLHLHADQRMALLAVRFHPHAVAPLLRVGGSALLAQPLDIAQLDHRLRRFHAGDAHPSIATAYAALLAVLRKLARDARAFDPLVQEALQRAESAPGQRVADLSRHLRISARTLERRFLQGTGLGVKTYLRIRRMQHSLQTLSQPHASATDVAHALGYADQAHMTRELVALAGVRPRDLMASGGQAGAATP